MPPLFTLTMDLIRTLEDDDEVKYASDEDSDDQDAPDAQPQAKKQKRKDVNKEEEFEPGFEFVGNQEQYMKDTWNDLSKYLKKKAKTTLDDKIAKVRKDMIGHGKEEEDGSEEGGELSNFFIP